MAQMSAALAQSLTCDPDLELQDLLDQEPLAACRFCGCTEFSPCPIAITRDVDGTMRLARDRGEAQEILACGWYLEGVCNAPPCIEKLIAEQREGIAARVLLFGADGRRIA